MWRTPFEAAWSIHEEAEPKPMPIAREPRRKARRRAREARGARFVRAGERSQTLNRHQGLGIEAVRMFATSDKPCVPLAKLVKHVWDFETSLKLPQFGKAMKPALKQLVRQKRGRAKKDSFGLTKR
jgi:hypothetical protein